MQLRFTAVLFVLLFVNYFLYAQMTELSKSEKKLYKKGVKANKKGQKIDALVFFNSIEKTNPKHIDNLYQLTVILFDDIKDYQKAYGYGNTLLQELNRRRNEISKHEKELKFDNDIENVRKEVSGIIDACKPFVDTSEDVVVANKSKNDLQIEEKQPSQVSNPDETIKKEDRHAAKSNDILKDEVILYQSDFVEKIHFLLNEHKSKKISNTADDPQKSIDLEVGDIDSMITQMKLMSIYKNEWIELLHEIERIEHILGNLIDSSDALSFYLVEHDHLLIEDRLDFIFSVSDENIPHQSILVLFGGQDYFSASESLQLSEVKTIKFSDDGQNLFVVGNKSTNNEILKLSLDSKRVLHSLKESDQKIRNDLIQTYQDLLQEKHKSMALVEAKLQQFNLNNEVFLAGNTASQFENIKYSVSLIFIEPEQDLQNNPSILAEKISEPLVNHFKMAGYEREDIDAMDFSDGNLEIRSAENKAFLLSALLTTKKEEKPSHTLKSEINTSGYDKPRVTTNDSYSEKTAPKTEPKREASINEVVVLNEVSEQENVEIEPPVESLVNWRLLEDNPTSYSVYVLFQTEPLWRLPTFDELEALLNEELKTSGNLLNILRGNKKIHLISSDYSLGNRNNNLYRGFLITHNEFSIADMEAGDEVHVILVPNINN